MKRYSSSMTILAIILTIMLLSTAAVLPQSKPELNQELFRAVSNRDLDAVKRAIQKGASVNARNDKGFTPMMSAAFSGELAIVKYLVAKGADVNTRSNADLTAFAYAYRMNNEKVAAFLKNNGAYISDDMLKPFFPEEIGTSQMMIDGLIKNDMFDFCENMLKENLREFKKKHEKKEIKKKLAYLYFARAQKYDKNKQYQKALQYYRKAYNRYKNDWPRQSAFTLVFMANSYCSINQRQKALVLYREALPIFRFVKEKYMELFTLNQIGNAYASLGDMNNAVAAWEHALVISRDIDEWYEETVCLSSLAVAYAYLGMPEKASVYAEKAQELGNEYNYHSEDSVLYNSLGTIYAYLEQYQTAIRYMKKALKTPRNPAHKKLLLANIGIIFLLNHQRNKAETFLLKALAIKLENDGNEYETLALMGIGFLSSAFDRHEQGLAFLKQSISNAKQSGMIYHEAMGRINLGLILQEIGRNREAARQLEQAVNVLDRTRFELKKENLKTSFFSSYIDVYKKLITLHYQTESHRSGLLTVEKSKSVIFAEMMAKRKTREKTAKKNPEFKKILNRETQLLLNINHLKKQAGPGKNKKSNELKKRYRELFTLQDQMKEKFPKAYRLLYPEAIPLNQLQQLLKPGETYISFSLLKKYSLAFVVDRDRFHTVKLPVNRNWVESRVIKLRNQIAAARDAVERRQKNDARRFFHLFPVYSRYAETANALYMKLFKPLIPYIHSRSLVISADGALYGFPFEALVTGRPGTFDLKGKKYSLNQLAKKEFSGLLPLFWEYNKMKYLGDQYHISYIPTALTLSVLRDKTPHNSKQTQGVIAFANPVFSSQKQRAGAKERGIPTIHKFIEGQIYVKQRAIKAWPPDPLPETAGEANTFVKHIGKGKVYKGLEASEKNVWNADLENAKYILFSTHGLLGKEAGAQDIAEPALVLSLVNNPEGYDGLLGMTEAAGLRLNCDLVILSACSSAGQSGKGGEGFAGMARSFLFAGSRAVVASHWPVNSRATKILMEHYAKHLETKGRLEALEAARRTVKNSIAEYSGKNKTEVSFAHPYYWASFVLLGER